VPIFLCKGFKPFFAAISHSILSCTVPITNTKPMFTSTFGVGGCPGFIYWSIYLLSIFDCSHVQSTVHIIASGTDATMQNKSHFQYLVLWSTDVWTSRSVQSCPWWWYSSPSWLRVAHWQFKAWMSFTAISGLYTLGSRTRPCTIVLVMTYEGFWISSHVSGATAFYTFGNRVYVLSILLQIILNWKFKNLFKFEFQFTQLF